MLSGREQTTNDLSDLDGLETEDPTVRVRVHEEKATGKPERPTRSVLAKSGGRLAQWFKLRASLVPTEPSIPGTEEPEEFEKEGESDESFALDSTAAGNSKSKSKKRPQPQKGGDKAKRRPSAMASEHSSDAGEILQPQGWRRSAEIRSSTSRSGRRLSAEIPESSSKMGERTTPTPLQKLLILESHEQNERIKKLRDEMAEKLEEIREIKKMQVKNKVEEKLASEIVENQREHGEDFEFLRVTIRQELEETRVKPFKDKLKSDLEERMKAKQAQSRSDMENMRTKIRNDSASQTKALMLEHERKTHRELKPALVEAKIKVRQEAAEETQHFEAFVRAQVTHDCQKIDEECDSKIDAVKRARKERQLAVRQRGQETIENHRNRPERLQELDEKEKTAYSMVEIDEKEKLQKQKDIIETEVAQREALAMAALEQEAVQKLAHTRTMFEEQNLKKLQECLAEIEREVEVRTKSGKIAQAGEKRKSVDYRRSLREKLVENGRTRVSLDKQGKLQIEKLNAESSPSSELLANEPDIPKLTFLEKELLREAQKSLKNLDSTDSSSVLRKTLKSLESADSSALKKGLKSLDSSASPASKKSGVGKVKQVLFEGLASLKQSDSPHRCTCFKDGHFTCVPLVETAVEYVKQARERSRGRSFAHPHSRESIYKRLAREPKKG